MIAFNMKKSLLFLVFMLLSQLLFGQMKEEINLDFKTSLINGKSLIQFIESDFKPFKLSQYELLVQKNPLSSKNMNREVKSLDKAYKLLNLPIIKINCFYKNDNEGAIFILMNINSEEILNFVNALGIPENTLKEDFERGDYDILMWRKNGFEILIQNSFIDRYSKDIKIVTISHVINYMELYNFDSWD
jgi:hypothetical protein